MELITQSWPWYITGPLITFTVFLLLYIGKRFGVSSNLETLCSIAGADKVTDYFKVDLKKKSWGLLFVLGIVIGGFIASNFLSDNASILISSDTVNDLADIGITDIDNTHLPTSLFSLPSLLTLRGFILLVVGGFLIGFGTRYAGGCTSGHAISGLSNLELPSLIAVIGFFIGGLIMTNFLLPYIINL